MFFKIGVFRNFPIFTRKHLCLSFFLIKLQTSQPPTLPKTDFNTGVFLWILRNFYEKLFDRKPPVASVDLLFLIKSNVALFLLKRVDLVETIPTRLYRFTCRNQKFVRSKPLQQRLFVLILGFWQYRQVFVHYLMSILMICKLTRGCVY